MNCKDCQWFLRNEKGEYGQCHLTPKSHGWPVVRASDFCSHFTEKRHATTKASTNPAAADTEGSGI